MMDPALLLFPLVAATALATAQFSSRLLEYLATADAQPLREAVFLAQHVPLSEALRRD